MDGMETLLALAILLALLTWYTTKLNEQSRKKSVKMPWSFQSRLRNTSIFFVVIISAQCQLTRGNIIENGATNFAAAAEDFLAYFSDFSDSATTCWAEAIDDFREKVIDPVRTHVSSIFVFLARIHLLFSLRLYHRLVERMDIIRMNLTM